MKNTKAQSTKPKTVKSGNSEVAVKRPSVEEHGKFIESVAWVDKGNGQLSLLPYPAAFKKYMEKTGQWGTKEIFQRFFRPLQKEARGMMGSFKFLGRFNRSTKSVVQVAMGKGEVPLNSSLHKRLAELQSDRKKLVLGADTVGALLTLHKACPLTSLDWQTVREHYPNLEERKPEGISILTGLREGLASGESKLANIGWNGRGIMVEVISPQTKQSRISKEKLRAIAEKAKEKETQRKKAAREAAREEKRMAGLRKPKDKNQADFLAAQGRESFGEELPDSPRMTRQERKRMREAAVA